MEICNVQGHVLAHLSVIVCHEKKEKKNGAIRALRISKELKAF